MKESELIPTANDISNSKAALLTGDLGQSFYYVHAIEVLPPDTIKAIRKSNNVEVQQRLLGAVRLDFVGTTGWALQTFSTAVAYERVLYAFDILNDFYENADIIDMAKSTTTKIDGTYCKFDLEMKIDTAEFFFASSIITGDQKFSLLGLNLLAQIQPEDGQEIFNQATLLAEKEKQRVTSNYKTLHENIWKNTRRLVPREIVTAVNKERDKYIEKYAL
ncbi:MAG TPA: hypothetical protein VLF89_00970 [Candidatus Saccharimonadales bacterium]|nr:hypothetical protein [Candidatus Saccharimonadales bacterium]